MTQGAREIVEVANREEWRAWLEAHHEQRESILLVTHRKGTSERYIPYPELVEEALCFGWIDSTKRRIDDTRSTLLLSPRRRRSGWSAVNKARVEKLVAEGRMMPAGISAIERAREDESWTRFDAFDEDAMPDELRAALAANPEAHRAFESFPPSYRRNMNGWVQEAKRPETRARRIERIVAAAARNEQVGY